MEPEIKTPEIPHHRQKRLILIAIAVIGVCFVILFLFLSGSDKTKETSVPQDGSKVIIPTKVLTNTSKVIKTGFLEASIPKDWEAVPAVISGGEEIGFRPKGLEVGDFIPSVYVIKFNNATPALLSNQRAQFDKLSYQQTDVDIDETPAILLSGEYPFYTKNGQIIKEPHQDKVYYLNYEGGLIQIRLRYPKESVDQNTQAALSYILNSINLK